MALLEVLDAALQLGEAAHLLLYLREEGLHAVSVPLHDRLDLADVRELGLDLLGHIDDLVEAAVDAHVLAHLLELCHDGLHHGLLALDAGLERLYLGVLLVERDEELVRLDALHEAHGFRGGKLHLLHALACLEHHAAQLAYLAGDLGEALVHGLAQLCDSLKLSLYPGELCGDALARYRRSGRPLILRLLVSSISPWRGVEVLLFLLLEHLGEDAHPLPPLVI